MNKRYSSILYIILSIILLILYLSIVYCVLKLVPFSKESFYLKLLFIFPLLFLLIILNPLLKYAQQIVDTLFKRSSIDKIIIKKKITDLFLKNIPNKKKMELFSILLKRYLNVNIDAIFQLSYNRLVYEQVFYTKKKIPFILKDDINLSDPYIIILPIKDKSPVFIFFLDSSESADNCKQYFKVFEKYFLEHYHNLILKNEILSQLNIKKFHSITQKLIPLIDTTMREIISAMKYLNNKKELYKIKNINFQKIINQFNLFMDKRK